MSTNSRKRGYGSPPREHQFKKGQSGNPRGRPKKSVNRTTVLLRTLNEQVLAEAERPISVREGDVACQMTVQEAFVRMVTAKAMKGDRCFAKLLQQMIYAAQRDSAKQKESYYDAIWAYKSSWEAEFARCDRLGLPRPEPVPHPDDIQANPRTGEVRFVGPLCEEEKQLADLAVAQRDKIIAWLERPNPPDIGGPEMRRKVRDRHVKRLEEINASLPARLRRTYKEPDD